MSWSVSALRLNVSSAYLSLCIGLVDFKVVPNPIWSESLLYTSRLYLELYDRYVPESEYKRKASSTKNDFAITTDISIK